ncbi:hypothetical protein [Fusobacterium pseudoperiodonticum]|uniref:Lipoprotein n=1 Tax=Fusobacterium pseudoperiodonticum TaxID=2663009 RepID=A0A2D3PNI2_9FUSO|nr:hypothetical protein [Fusobacterium pseudoperiodonticum]ATV69252.1 hypothetical protein CTM98_00245 [Fusobacterium pseudoperiodonticum]
MIKRMIILIIMGLTLSSCQLFTEAIKDNMYRVELARERKEARKKDAYAAAGNPEYEAGVELAIQDIKKRPVNKRVEFGGTTLLIPENTRLNPKHGNIVDEKTGYGIAILFEIEDYCTDVFYRKKISSDKYILLYYNNEDKDLNVIGQKIIKANGFTKTCK